MSEMPVLSIGIIFKDEIRCLERCLKSLEPLRAAIPCQLVMADTGSGDGSRAVAEKYADVLFDFPWINDFAAARNAVLDRCRGSWCLTVDADEWLDGDITELLAFLRGWDGRPDVLGAVTVRNYSSYDLHEQHMDSLAARLACMAEQPRYAGAIHERWEWPGRQFPTTLLRRTVLHHDGYVEMNLKGEAGGRKRARNMALLRKQLERTPDNLLLYLQMLESGRGEPDYLDILYRAVSLVEERKPYWEMAGPPVMRYAVILAGIDKLPERGEWIQKAEEWFPDSAFTRIDVAFQAFAYFLARDEFEEAARRGETYLKALAEDRAGRLDPAARLRSVLQSDSVLQEQALKISLADVYQRAGRTEDAYAALLSLDGYDLDGEQAGDFVRALRYIHAHSDADSGALLLLFWERINQPGPVEGREKERKTAFLLAAARTFEPDYRSDERQQEGFRRPAYTLFLPLAGRCAPGTAAAMLETEDAARLEELLATVEDWTALPPEALDHALRRGVRFPLPGKRMNVETMDLLAARLAGEPEALFRLARTVEWDVPQTLCWARALLLAAVRAFDWKVDTFDGERGLALARRFAAVEKAFLSLCYAPEALAEEGLFLLPLLHRFGWYCVRAFAALEAGDAAMYARHLREGLASCPEMKPMVEFLTEHTLEFQAPPPSPELLALAEQVRTMLAAYDPNDPAVAAIKASPAYQRVAHLIEGGGV